MLEGRSQWLASNAVGLAESSRTRDLHVKVTTYFPRGWASKKGIQNAPFGYASGE
jgi:hypothetical protein